MKWPEKPSKPMKTQVQITFASVVAAVMIGGLTFSLYSAEPQSGAQPLKTDSSSSQTNSVAPKVDSTNSVKVVVKSPLTGAELYSINCNRCHPERAPTDWTGAQWKTIMLQMQVRANIPAKQSKLILQYLQENSGR
jgi:hypothetical protein